MLFNSKDALYYAANGLNIWYEKMIPTLFPFMILSGILIKTGYSIKIAKLCYPVIGKMFSLSYDCVYIILMGFLCGFPMGAAMIAESIKYGRITKQEGNCLLAFTNNIEPVYFISFICLYCPYLPVIAAFLIMYLVPLVYGLIMRYTQYKELKCKNTKIFHNSDNKSLFKIIDDSIHDSIENITKLGGYMIFFNLLNLIFVHPMFCISDKYQGMIACLLEISGGVMQLKNYPQFFPDIYIILPIGEISCIAQTYSIIHNCGLNIRTYIYHKINQCIITVLIYFFVFVFFLLLNK